MKKSSLTLIRGGQSADWRCGRTLVCAAHPGEAPFEIDAIVLEEDKHRVLSAPRIARQPAEHQMRVLTDAAQWEPAELGSVVVTGGDPVRLHAIVCDLDSPNPCEPIWICAALGEMIETAKNLGLRSIAVELLGAVHGGVPAEQAAELFWDAVAQVAHTTAMRIWLVVPQHIEPARMLDPARRLTTCRTESAAQPTD